MDDAEAGVGGRFQDASGKKFDAKGIEEQISKIAHVSLATGKTIGLHVSKEVSSEELLTFLTLLAQYQIQNVTIFDSSGAIYLEDFCLKSQTK